MLAADESLDETVARGYDFLRWKMEVLDERLPVPIADAENEIDVLLQGTVLEIFESGLIEGIAAPEDHAWGYTAEQKWIERAK